MAASLVHISIEDCKEASRQLADWIEEKYGCEDIEGLVAVLNAGVFPAYWIRKILKKKRQTLLPLRTVDVYSYDSRNEQQDMTIIDTPDLSNQGKGWIFVDEVADTGQTFRTLKDLYPEATFLALTAKPKGKPSCDRYVFEYDQDEWIVFPWEIEED